MNDLHPPIPDADLHRWADRRLDAASRERIEAAMSTDPALAATLRAWRAQRDALAELGRAWLDEPMPDGPRTSAEGEAASEARTPPPVAPPPLTSPHDTAPPVAATRARAEPSMPADVSAGRAASDRPRPARRPAGSGTPPRAKASVTPVTPVTPAAGGPRARAGRTGWPAVAAIALASAGLGFAVGRGGLAVPGSGGDPGAAPAVAAPTPPGFVRAALNAHTVYAPEIRHPVEVAGAERGHLVAWLSKRLGTPVSAPDLAAQGFELVGGRLLPGEHGPNAQFMYQDTQGLRVTLYLAKRDAEATGGTAFRFERTGALQTFYWIDRGLGYVLSGELPRERLSDLATAAHRSLEGAGR